MKDCVFCKIIAGEIPCHKIYEDDFVFAFLDNSNDVYGHTLIVPKKHFESMATCDNSMLEKVIQAAKKVGNHYVEDCGFDGFNVLNNCGQSADQSVMHMHFHVIPRKKDDHIVASTKLAGCGEKRGEGETASVEIFAKPNNKKLAEVCRKLRIKPEEPEPIDDQNAVVLYTDGACSGNPGAGGWSAIMRFRGKEKVISGGEEDTTNNRMELMAVIAGLESIKSNVPVQVFSDSAYVVNAFHQHWLENWQKKRWRNSDKKEVLNKDLWLKLLAQTQRLDVTFNKVKGHGDDVINNRCDALARAEIKKFQE